MTHSARSTDPPNPALWARPDVRAILAVRDISGLFRLLQRERFSRRRIAALVDPQLWERPEVRAILAERDVGAMFRPAVSGEPANGL
jgi:hypothetical protein